MLGEILMPDVDEVNQDPEFSATAITATEFEQVWQRATRALNGRCTTAPRPAKRGSQ
jgi:hypothetical protein